MVGDEFSNDRVGGLNWDDSPDLTSVSDENLRLVLEKLATEERDISYQRRVLQGRIDLIRVELSRRGKLSLTPEELARIMMDPAPPEQEGEPEA